VSWRDTLLPASFRGVALEVEEVGAAGGRRGTDYVYPGADGVYASDAGAAAEQVRLSAYLIGADYPARREQLVEALNKEGPGVLVHPYRGAMLVQVRSWDLVERTAEGGLAQFRLTFTRTGLPSAPSLTLDSVDTLGAAASAVDSDAAEAYALALTNHATLPVALASQVTSQAIEQVARVQGAFEALGPSQFRDAVQAKQLLQALFALSATAISAPGDFAAALAAALAEISPSEALTFAASNQTRPTLPFVATTPQEQLTNEELAAVAAVTQRATLTGIARSLALTDLVSRDEADDLRDRFAALVAAEIALSTDDVVASLQQLLQVVVSDLRERGARLARLVDYTAPPATIPALVLAWDLYADPSREAQIRDINSTPDALQITGTIRVLEA